MGRKLHIKITEVISAEVEAITEEDCIGYMVNMVTEKHGGKVFYIISIKEGGKKKIHNIEVITEIEQEIERLQKWTIQTKNC